LKGCWIKPEIRDQIVDYIEGISRRTKLDKQTIIPWLGIHPGKYYDWKKRYGFDNYHNGQIPKSHWILPEEYQAVLIYARKYYTDGYKRFAYEMLDKDIVALSPSTVYRILKAEGLLHSGEVAGNLLKGIGFDQPTRIHEHWHTDIKYVNFHSAFLFLISVFDGYSRYNLHHELCTQMEEYHVELTIQRAIEKFPGNSPRLISDNGSQFISGDFRKFLREVGLDHVRTSVRYPQSNGKIERFHRTLKDECLSRQSLIDLDDARKQVAAYIANYNTKRLHSALYYLTPEDFLLDRVDARLAERNRKLKQAVENRKIYAKLHLN